MRSCRAKRRLLLTGSPIQNNLDELYNLGNTLFLIILLPSPPPLPPTLQLTHSNSPPLPIYLPLLVSFACPGYFGSLASFRSRYSQPIARGGELGVSDWERKEARAAAEQLRFLLNQIMLRRTQNEILKKVLPPRTDVVIFTGLTPQQERVYDAAAKKILGNVTEHGVLEAAVDKRGGEDDKPEMVLSTLQNLRRICNYAGAVVEATPAPVSAPPPPSRPPPAVQAPVPVSTLSKPSSKFTAPKQVAPPIVTLLAKPVGATSKIDFDVEAFLSTSSKFQILDALLDIVRTHTAEKVVLVSHSTQTLEKVQALLTHRGYESLLLQGNTPIDQRQSLVDRFNRASDPAFCFMLSSKAGGVGINLPGGSRLISLDVDWNPAIDMQAMSRIYREGQKRPTFIYRLCAHGRMEETMLQRQFDKGSLASHAMNEEVDSSSSSSSSSSAPEHDEVAQIAVPKTKQSLKKLVYPRDDDDGNIGKTLTSYEHDDVLRLLEERLRGSGNIHSIILST